MNLKDFGYNIKSEIRMLLSVKISTKLESAQKVAEKKRIVLLQDIFTTIHCKITPQPYPNN